MEVINTAVEELVDLLHPGKSPAAGRVKDLAAGAVLLAAIGAAVAGVLILGPPLWVRLFGV
jgi:diacylglycerol kinase